ncbi:MAG: PilZ domain-containing protein [Planctomycetes bacterium]|nr:PilZ domain-containing protein [Planctomycetota bacterium]
MTDDVDKPSERRVMPRSDASGGAIVYREADMMRRGLPAVLLDVSTGGVGLSLAEKLPENEQIRVAVKNDIQRFQKEIRGVVRRVFPLDDGQWRIGVELYGRLTPMEVTMLRSGIKPKAQDGGTQWV